MIVIPNSLMFLANESIHSSRITQQNYKNIALILFICLMGFLSFGYIALWLPFVFTLVDELFNAQKMLSIIPVEAGQGIPKMQTFLNDFYLNAFIGF